MSLKGKPSSSVRPREPVLIFTDTLFLLMAVMGTIYAFCGAYSLVPGRGVLLSGLVASLLFAAVFSMPRFRWIPLALFAGLSAVAVWKLWPQLRRGAYAVYTSVANVLAEWFSVDLIELPDTLSAAEWQGVRNLFLSAAVIVLALMLGWTVVRLHSALLTMVLTLSPLLPGLLFEAPPPWPALMTLAACWLALLFTAQLRGKPQNGAGRFALLALPACVLLVCLLSTAFPQETYSHPQWALNAYLRLTDWGARFFNGIFPGGPAVGTAMSAGTAAGVNLGDAGPLEYTGQTVLRISAEVPGRVYLRSFSAAVYDRNQWRQIDADDYEAFAEAAGLDWSGASQPAYFPFFNNARRSMPHWIEIENIAAPPGIVYYPSQLVPASSDASIENAAFSGDICLIPQNDVRIHRFYYSQPDDLLRVSAPRADGAWEPERLYREFVEGYYLGVPEQFEESIADWWRDAQPLWEGYNPNADDFPSRYRERLSAAWKVAYALEQTAQYDTEAEAVPSGEDFVSYFLTQSRRGYCMHFASAAVLLLRSMGIPARYVSGYAVTVPEPGTVNVPDSAAHAWVEIYLDGYGWHPVEVTPAAGIDATLPDETAAETVLPDAPAPEEEDADMDEAADAPIDEDTENRTEEENQDAARTKWQWILLLPAAAALIAARRALVLWMRRRRIHGTDINRGVLAAYGWLSDLQRWGAKTTEEVDDLARKARFSQHTLTKAERDVVLRQLDQEIQRIDHILGFWQRLVCRYVFVMC